MIGMEKERKFGKKLFLFYIIYKSLINNNAIGLIAAGQSNHS